MAEHHTRLKPFAMPIKHNAYHPSPLEYDYMEKEILMLQNLGYIKRCKATWVMIVIMVKKKYTTDFRMCIEYRSLNKEMLIENYPIPQVDDILN